MWIVKYQYFEFTLQWGKELDILLKYLILNSISLYYVMTPASRTERENSWNSPYLVRML